MWKETTIRLGRVWKFCGLTTSNYVVDKGSGMYRVELASTLPLIDHPLLLISRLAITLNNSLRDTGIRKNKKASIYLQLFKDQTGKILIRYMGRKLSHNCTTTCQTRIDYVADRTRHH